MWRIVLSIHQSILMAFPHSTVSMPKNLKQILLGTPIFIITEIVNML